MSRVAATLALLASVSGKEHSRTNITIYRITPRNYTGLTNLNTGDPASDAFFGLLELSKPLYDCDDPKVASRNLFCKNAPILQIPGFNVYTQNIAEVDARFGHYSECNPDPDNGTFACAHSNWRHQSTCWFNDTHYNTSFQEECDPTQCLCPIIEEQAVGQEYIGDMFGGRLPSHWPQQCQDHMSPLPGRAIKRGVHTRVVRVADEGACCGLCSQSATCQAYTYRAARRSCDLHNSPVNVSDAFVQAGATSGMNQDHTPFHSPLGAAPAKLAVLLNGSWYSTRQEGMCKEGQVPGRDGCFWRLVNTTRNVNASCVNGNVIKAVQAKRPGCWDACPQPTNMSSPCWIFCLFETLVGNETRGIPAMKREEVTGPFEASFASDDPAKGGCPEVPPCPSPCKPDAEMEKEDAEAVVVV